MHAYDECCPNFSLLSLWSIALEGGAPGGESRLFTIYALVDVSLSEMDLTPCTLVLGRTTPRLSPLFHGLISGRDPTHDAGFPLASSII